MSNNELSNEQLKLKVLAYKEALAESQDKVAELRVELTILSDQMDKLAIENGRLQQELDSKDHESESVDTVEGEIIE